MNTSKMSSKHVAVMILFLASNFVLLVASTPPSFNVNSFPMIQSNVQRNGMCSNATALQNSTLFVSWVFTEPDDDSFRDAPIYSADDHAVYVASYTGFVYGIDSILGTQLWESCVGVPPKFPGDPCSDSGIDSIADFPYGQTTLLSEGNVIILRAPAGKYQEAMICLNKTTGKTMWSYTLPEYTSFASTPTVLPQEGGDAILIWVDSYTKIAYTIINGTTGESISAAPFLDKEYSGPVAAMSYDPTDGTIVSQYTNTRKCSGYGCLGIAKFDTFTGAVVWNQSMEQSHTNGMIAIDVANNAVYVTSNQEDAYAYALDTGAPLWMAQSVVFATADMAWSSVCADGTVLIVDNKGAINAYNPTPERVMTQIWRVDENSDPISGGITTLSDNTFVYSDNNLVIARSCNSSDIIWLQDFGDTDNGPGAIVAVSNDSVFANAYWPGKGTGMIVKITDARSHSPPCSDCPHHSKFD